MNPRMVKAILSVFISHSPPLTTVGCQQLHSMTPRRHQAWQLLGEEEIARLVDESVNVWGRVSCVVTDRPDEIDAKPLRLTRSRS